MRMVKMERVAHSAVACGLSRQLVKSAARYASSSDGSRRARPATRSRSGSTANVGAIGLTFHKVLLSLAIAYPPSCAKVA